VKTKVSPERREKLAQAINEHAYQILANGGGDEELMRSMYDIMPDVKIIMDSSTHNDMDALCYRYDGFYRVMKLLEMTAQAISEGAITVPTQTN